MAHDALLDFWYKGDYWFYALLVLWIFTLILLESLWPNGRRAQNIRLMKSGMELVGRYKNNPEVKLINYENVEKFVVKQGLRDRITSRFTIEIWENSSGKVKYLTIGGFDSMEAQELELQLRVAMGSLSYQDTEKWYGADEFSEKQAEISNSLSTGQRLFQIFFGVIIGIIILVVTVILLTSY